MILPSYFADFLSNIRLTQNQISDLKKGHETLRKRLLSDDNLSSLIVSTFLQGSYRRATAVRPSSGKRSDVDVIVVTNIDAQTTSPQEALNKFKPFLEKHYKDKYRLQGRSIGIELSYVDLDLVPTSAPAECDKELLVSRSVTIDEALDDLLDWRLRESWIPAYERDNQTTNPLVETDEPEWRLSPLLIPDREAEAWTPTHPLEQIRWTRDKNRACHGHYINVVKAIKWWKRLQDPDGHPKSYPLEHLIGVCCPDDISNVAEGIVKSLETIVKDYPTKPSLPDHGVPEHDVFGRITDQEYGEFYALVKFAASVAREAYEAKAVSVSAKLWRELLGNKFPEPPSNDGEQKDATGGNGFTERTGRTTLGGGRFA